MNTTCPPARVQGRQHGERQRDRSDDVDAHRGAPFVDRRLRDPAGIRDTGVVDQHVELHDRLHDGLDGVGVGQVDGPGRGAEALGHLVEPLRRAAREKQRVGGGERSGDGATEPAACARDHGRSVRRASAHHRGGGLFVARRSSPGTEPDTTDLRFPRRRPIMEPMPPDPTFAPTQLAARAAYLLRGNDLGSMTTAAPLLYPHMWSWDAAFVSIGLAPLSVERAVVELDTLLSAQWGNGMIPHIVFANGVDGYFPGPARWATSALAANAPAKPAHVRHHSAAGARHRRAAHPRPRPHARPVDARRRRGVPRPTVGRSGALAPLARRGARPEVARPGHGVPRLGVRHGQLPALGQRLRQRDSRRTCRSISARTTRSTPMPASGRRTSSTTATCGCSRR